MWSDIWLLLCWISATGNFVLAMAYREGWGIEQDIPKAIFALVMSMVAYNLRRW